jgi:hypothetical protein
MGLGEGMKRRAAKVILLLLILTAAGAAGLLLFRERTVRAKELSARVRDSDRALGSGAIIITWPGEVPIKGEVWMQAEVGPSDIMLQQEFELPNSTKQVRISFSDDRAGFLGFAIWKADSPSELPCLQGYCELPRGNYSLIKIEGPVSAEKGNIYIYSRWKETGPGKIRARRSLLPGLLELCSWYKAPLILEEIDWQDTKFAPQCRLGPPIAKGGEEGFCSALFFLTPTATTEARSLPYTAKGKVKDEKGKEYIFQKLFMPGAWGDRQRPDSLILDPERDKGIGALLIPRK